MFAYIKGTLEAKMKGFVVEIGDTVKVHTYYYVREDNISLYGFLSKEELKMFELLLSVSGIGAKSAISMLSNITPSSFAFAVISNDVATLKGLPGIGAKTAQRIILELQDKLKSEEKLAVDGAKEQIAEEIYNNENIKEAIQALQILGYNNREIDKVMKKLKDEKLNVEELIKKGLSLLSR